MARIRLAGVSLTYIALDRCYHLLNIKVDATAVGVEEAVEAASPVCTITPGVAVVVVLRLQRILSISVAAIAPDIDAVFRVCIVAEIWSDPPHGCHLQTTVLPLVSSPPTAHAHLLTILGCIIIIFTMSMATICASLPPKLPHKEIEAERADGSHRTYPLNDALHKGSWRI